MLLTKQLLHTTPAYIKKLTDAGIVQVTDFLKIFPRDIEDKSHILTQFTKVSLQEKHTVLCSVEVIQSEITRNKKVLIKAILKDSDGNYSEAVWFNRKYLLQQFTAGDKVIIFGMPKYEYGKLSFPNADIEHYRSIRREIVPIYSDINYIPGTWICEKMALLKTHIHLLSDEVPEPIRKKRNMRSWAQSVFSIHFPSSLEDFNRAKEEIGYTELFRFQKIGIEKKYRARIESTNKSLQIPIDASLMQDLIASLPFTLTSKQKIVIWAILKDMELPHTMARMLQGDVGTGKTVVALLVAIHAILVHRRNGDTLPFQVAIMAPTEILAQQHFLGQKSWLTKWGIRSDILSGSLKASQKKSLHAAIKSGEIEIIFGTHALIQEQVTFAKLGLVVIDEQHRFGVEQRKVLEEFCSPIGESCHASPDNSILPHVLHMSATPIPRSLTLTLYGDQDISILNTYPEGRKPIHTRVIKEFERESVYQWIREILKKGEQVYWISPLVEDSEMLDIASATSMQELLQDIFPDATVGLIHGKMTGEEKESIMQDFYKNHIQILSSTSVIEIGVNNPNATVICIEASERFGLSQLHQFRGRVGRGTNQSYCYLFTSKEYTNDRLNAIVSTNDGFELSEIDLELRGPGEVYGVRQSGLPDLHFSDIRDLDLIATIREDIEEWMQPPSHF